jgi:hypothetical protein
MMKPQTVDTRDGIPHVIKRGANMERVEVSVEKNNA